MQEISLFFSYSNKEIDIVRNIYNKFSKETILNIWFDKENINGGDELEGNIANGISNNVDYFIIFISESIFNSKWVKFEMEQALKKYVRILKYKFIIPVFIGNKDNLLLKLEESDNVFFKELHQIIEEQIENIHLSDRILSTKTSDINDEKINKLLKSFYNILINDFRTNVAEQKKPLYFDIETAKEFYKSSKKSNRGIFFNVQIDIQEWFRPEFQVHLALQKSIEDSINFRNINICQTNTNLKNINICKSSIPKMIHSRILFVTYSSEELHRMFKSNKDKIVNFRSFINIHNLMGSPLAIIPIDYLVDILSSNDFFKSEEVLKVLGLPLDFSTENNISRHNENILNSLKKSLQKQTNILGVVNPNIDFAIFDNSFEFNKPDIWCGSVSKKNEIFYYQVPFNGYPNLNGFAEDRIKSIDVNKKRYEFLKVFAKIIIKEVFIFPKNKIKLSDNKEYSERLELNPKYNVFSNKLKDQDTSDLFIKYFYSPWFYKFHEKKINAEEYEFPYFT